MKWAVIVLGGLALAGCRLSINKWGGTPPRAGDTVKIALAKNSSGHDLAKRVLAADARVSVIDADPPAQGLDAACAWSKDSGADYYAAASFDTNYEQTTKCVREGGSLKELLDNPKHSPPCAEEKVTSEGSRSAFALHVYDATTCHEIPSLSQEVTSYVPGGKDESTVEASMQVGNLAPTKYQGFPDQTSIAPSGTIVNAPGDGEYALFRQREFQGIARLHHAGTPREHIHMLMCCEEPEPGDVLVKRGPMKFIEFDISFDTAILSSANNHQGAYGAGIHLRHRRLAGGLELGVSGDIMQSTDLGAGLLSINTGYGYQLTPLLHLSANAELGFARLLQDVGNPGGELVRAWTPYVMPQLRAQAAVRWWYVGLDLGYAMSSTVGAGDWDGPNAGMAVDARLRGPLARLYAGITL